MQALRHYLDDFFGACKSKATAQKLYNDLIKLIRILGIPTTPQKYLPPSNIYQNILGWGIKQNLQKICLPEDKRIEYLSEVKTLIKEKTTDKRFLQHVRGRLGNVAQIKFPGKHFCVDLMH